MRIILIGEFYRVLNTLSAKLSIIPALSAIPKKQHRKEVLSMKKFIRRNPVETLEIILLVIFCTFFSVYILITTPHINSTPNALSYEDKADVIRAPIEEYDCTHGNENPENWKILEVSSDFSMAKVEKENGLTYWFTVYEANDTTISLVLNGEIHEYYY